MSAMTSEIIAVLLVNSTVCSGEDQSKHQSSASLVCVREIHRCDRLISAVTGEFPAQKPVTRNMFPFDDAIAKTGNIDVGDECSYMKCKVSAPP